MAYASLPEEAHEDLTDWLMGDDARLLDRHRESRLSALNEAGVEVVR